MVRILFDLGLPTFNIVIVNKVQLYFRCAIIASCSKSINQHPHAR
jgi:hypothetical protein